jgi:hypothetical protein
MLLTSGGLGPGLSFTNKNTINNDGLIICDTNNNIKSNGNIKNGVSGKICLNSFEVNGTITNDGYISIQYIYILACNITNNNTIIITNLIEIESVGSIVNNNNGYICANTETINKGTITNNSSTPNSITLLGTTTNQGHLYYTQNSNTYNITNLTGNPVEPTPPP